jgi:hypothetical protein
MRAINLPLFIYKARYTNHMDFDDHLHLFLASYLCSFLSMHLLPGVASAPFLSLARIFKRLWSPGVDSKE